MSIDDDREEVVRIRVQHYNKTLQNQRRQAGLISEASSGLIDAERKLAEVINLSYLAQITHVYTVEPPLYQDASDTFLTKTLLNVTFCVFATPEMRTHHYLGHFSLPQLRGILVHMYIDP